MKHQADSKINSDIFLDLPLRSRYQVNDESGSLADNRRFLARVSAEKVWSMEGCDRSGRQSVTDS